MIAYFTHVVCLECGHEFAADLMAAACPRCHSGWLDARYDYAAVADVWRNGLRARDGSLWRYNELLPIRTPDPEISLHEGYTPLIRLYQYERIYNHPHLYIKDERQGPTSSFKDRQAAMAVTAMKQAGITECVLASTGNAAAAYAAYCARAGIKLWLFLTSLVPQEKMREAALYGAEVVRVSGTYDETKHVAAEFAKRRGIHLDRGAKAIPGKESMKTLGFEIAEQLGLAFDGRGWHAPDWYIQAVSGGIGPLGVWKAFQELYAMGLIDHLPKLGVVQASGCAPMVTAFQAQQAKATPVVPKTLITVLATGDPGFSYDLLYAAVQQTGGTMLAVDDGDTFAAMRHIASKAGLSVEPATAVAFAGLEKMLINGTIQPGETVVVNCSGHTFPAESHVLGDQYLLNLDVADDTTGKIEGLSAALGQLDEQVTTIVVVDDNPNDRRLIRRLLRAYKNYRVFEAKDGADALRLIHEQKPDLIVTDLTMPEMDGFSLLEHLKANPVTASIPVVVVSAKSINSEDRDILNQFSESVWTKGNYETRELVDHIVTALGDTPLEITRRRPNEITVDTKIAPRTAVIIDDVEADRRLVRRYLVSSGEFSVSEANCGRDGLKLIYEQKPDLVVLDLTLPDMDGLSLLQTMQREESLKHIPVIIYSSRMLREEECQQFGVTVDKLIEKSTVNREIFMESIRELLV